MGYIFRLAARRRMRSASGLAISIGFGRLTNRPYQECLAALAASTEVPVAELEAISYGPPGDAVGWIRGVGLPTNLFDRRGWADRRLCPLCLREHPHHRAIWDLMFTAVCPVHAVRLADACRACGGFLRWIGSDLGRCRCGADLTLMAAEPMGVETLRGTAVVHGLLGNGRFREQAGRARSLPPFVDLGPGRTAEFMFRIGLELMAARPKVFSTEQPGELAWEAHVALNRGLDVAEGWPEAFLDALEMMHARSGQSLRVGLRGSAGAVERWLARLPEGSGMAVRQAVADFRTGRAARRRNGIWGR